MFNNRALCFTKSSTNETKRKVLEDMNTYLNELDIKEQKDFNGEECGDLWGYFDTLQAMEDADLDQKNKVLKKELLKFIKKLINKYDPPLTSDDELTFEKIDLEPHSDSEFDVEFYLSDVIPVSSNRRVSVDSPKPRRNSLFSTPIDAKLSGIEMLDLNDDPVSDVTIQFSKNK